MYEKSTACYPCEMQPPTNNVIEQIVMMRKRVQYSIDMIHNNIRRLCDVIGNN